MPTLKEAEQQMQDTLDALRREFATVRTGKATPALLDTVRVDAYGAKMPVNQVATVSTPDATMLVLTPFDRSIIGAIEKAIQSADLGLNPANDGTVIRIPIPPLNEERRREFVKLLHKMAEEGRVSIRHARHKANDEVKNRLKEHEIGEDEAHRTLDQIQKLTDDHVRQVDELLAHKEKEIMQV